MNFGCVSHTNRPAHHHRALGVFIGMSAGILITRINNLQRLTELLHRLLAMIDVKIQRLQDNGFQSRRNIRNDLRRRQQFGLRDAPFRVLLAFAAQSPAAAEFQNQIAYHRLRCDRLCQG